MARHPINLSQGFLRTNAGDRFAANGALRGWRPHSGSDWSPNKAGSQIPVYAMEAGTVIQINNWSTSNSGPGRFVTVQQKSGWFMYAHLSSVTVSVGQSVREGQQLGRMGTTGFSTGVHLHVTRFRTRAAALANAQMPTMRSGESVAAWSVRAGVNDPTAILKAPKPTPTLPKGKPVRTYNVSHTQTPALSLVKGKRRYLRTGKNGNIAIRTQAGGIKLPGGFVLIIAYAVLIAGKSGLRFKFGAVRGKYNGSKTPNFAPSVGMRHVEDEIPAGKRRRVMYSAITRLPKGEDVRLYVDTLDGGGSYTFAQATGFQW